ncbi:MAG: acyltransferase family protein [Promethearchaeota archaeon]
MTKDDYYFQIDILKTLAIFSVIAWHSFYGQANIFFEGAIFGLLHPVPLFFVIMGFNYGNSLRRRNWTYLRQMFSKEFFLQRFERFILPLILIDIICIVLEFIHYSNTGEQIIPANPIILLGAPVFPGPGSYFVTILLQFIFVFPLLYRLNQIDPKLSLGVGFGLDLAFQLIAPYITLFDQCPYLFDACILRYLSAISMGLWFCENQDLFAKRNIFVIIGTPISIVAVLSAFLFDNPIPFFRTGDWWATANIFTYFYAALVFLVGLKILPAQMNKFSFSFFQKLSKLTYHILLVQIVYYYPWIMHVVLVDLFSKGITNPLGLLSAKMLVLLIELILFTILAYGLFRLDSIIKIYSRKIASNLFKMKNADNFKLKSVSQNKVEDI